MRNTKILIEHNILCLEQGIDLLCQLDDAAYTRTAPPFYSSGIGDHLRHGLEHYISFLDGLDADHVDYDARKRDTRIATERTYAIQMTHQIINRLRAIRVDKPLRIKMDCGHDAAEGVLWSHSSIERDLQYLQAHTIHHYALIAMILRLQGLAPGPDFGVAPSTLAYRQLQTAEPSA